MSTVLAMRLRAAAFFRDLWTLYFICHDARLPAATKAFAVAFVVYAISPFDFVPEVLPALGMLDDVLLVQAGLMLIRQLVPPPILAEHRARADRALARISFGLVAVLILAIWIVGALLVANYLL